MKKIAALLVGTLVCSLAAEPAFAGDLTTSISKAATELAGQQSTAARGANPYMIPGLALIGGGGVVAVLGMLSTTSASCTVSTSTVACDTGNNKGLLFGGLGIAGVGVWLLMKGEHERKDIDVAITPRGAAVKKTIRF
jgi:hypothetical protein